MLDLEKIKSRREKLDLTMEQAAGRAGFSNRQHWYMIESGRRTNIELDTLGKIAEALECEPHELLKKAGRPKKRAAGK